jgi:hypothetical protein
MDGLLGLLVSFGAALLLAGVVSVVVWLVMVKIPDSRKDKFAHKSTRATPTPRRPAPIAQRPQPQQELFRKTGRHWILITVGVLAAVAVFAVVSWAVSRPSFTPAEQDYLGVVKQWPAPWPADEKLVSQGHHLCDALRDNPDMMSGAAIYLLDADTPQSVQQAQYQVGAAIGALCPDQAWRIR